MAELGPQIGVEPQFVRQNLSLTPISFHALICSGAQLFIRRPIRIGHEPEIYQPREIAIAFGNLRCGRGVFDNRDLEPLLQQLMHVLTDMLVLQRIVRQSAFDSELGLFQYVF